MDDHDESVADTGLRHHNNNWSEIGTPPIRSAREVQLSNLAGLAEVDGVKNGCATARARVKRRRSSRVASQLWHSRMRETHLHPSYLAHYARLMRIFS